MKERAIGVLRAIYQRIVNLEQEEDRVFERYERAEAAGDDDRVRKHSERLDELNVEIGGLYRELAAAENMFTVVFGYYPVRGKHY